VSFLNINLINILGAKAPWRSLDSLAPALRLGLVSQFYFLLGFSPANNPIMFFDI